MNLTSIYRWSRGDSRLLPIFLYTFNLQKKYRAQHVKIFENAHKRLLRCGLVKRRSLHTLFLRRFPSPEKSAQSAHKTERSLRHIITKLNFVDDPDNKSLGASRQRNPDRCLSNESVKSFQFNFIYSLIFRGSERTTSSYLI